MTADHCPTGRSPIPTHRLIAGTYGAIVVMVGGSAIAAAALVDAGDGLEPRNQPRHERPHRGGIGVLVVGSDTRIVSSDFGSEPDRRRASGA